MISDGQTPYEQLKISPDADQAEIRSSYLELRKELEDEELKRLKTAWELVWSPEHRATVDAFLFQLADPSVSADAIADTVENDKAVLDWSDFLDEESVVQDETVALKELFLRTTWLDLPFQQFFRRPMPALQQMPVPAPSLTPLTFSEFDPQKPFSVPADARAEPSAPPPNVFQQMNGRVQAWLASPRNPLHALAETVRLALTAPAKPSATYSATSSPGTRVDLTMLYLLVAVVLLFVVLSVSGYFIVRFLFLSETSPVQVVVDAFTNNFGSPSADAPVLTPSAPPTLLPNTTGDAEGEGEPGSVAPPDVSQASPSLSTTAQESSADSEQEGEQPPDTEGQAEPAPPPDPEEQPTAAPTVPSVVISVQTNSFTNVRSGPGGQYRVIEVAGPGQSLDAFGRTASSEWLQIRTTSGEPGWIFAQIVTTQNDLSSLPEATPPPLE